MTFSWRNRPVENNQLADICAKIDEGTAGKGGRAATKKGCVRRTCYGEQSVKGWGRGECAS